jgi:hypothetical protein
MKVLFFLVEKSDERINAGTCANGSVQRTFMIRRRHQVLLLQQNPLYLRELLMQKKRGM